MVSPVQMEIPPFLVPSPLREEEQDLEALFQMEMRPVLGLTHQVEPSAILRTELGSMALVEKAELIPIFRVVLAE
jgi:hypothetical protein